MVINRHEAADYSIAAERSEAALGVSWFSILKTTKDTKKELVPFVVESLRRQSNHEFHESARMNEEPRVRLAVCKRCATCFVLQDVKPAMPLRFSRCREIAQD